MHRPLWPIPQSQIHTPALTIRRNVGYDYVVLQVVQDAVSNSNPALSCIRFKLHSNE